MTVADDAALGRAALAQLALEADDDLIERFCGELPSERLAPVMVAMHEAEGRLRKARTWLEGRYGAEVGLAWTDPNGDTWLWNGDGRWVVKDPAGFVAELERIAKAQPLWAGKIRAAFKPTFAFDNAALNSLRDLGEDLHDCIRDFRERVWGPKHLRRQETTRE